MTGRKTDLPLSSNKTYTSPNLNYTGNDTSQSLSLPWGGALDPKRVSHSEKPVKHPLAEVGQ